MAREQRRDRRRSNSRRDGGDNGGEDDLHRQILDVLLEKVRDDPYPSTTHLDLIEQIIRDDETDEYASILLDRVSGEHYPSLDILRRLQNYA